MRRSTARFRQAAQSGALTSGDAGQGTFVDEDFESPPENHLDTAFSESNLPEIVGGIHTGRAVLVGSSQHVMARLASGLRAVSRPMASSSVRVVVGDLRTVFGTTAV